MSYDTATADEVQWCVHDYPRDTCPVCATIEECARVAENFGQYNARVAWVAADIAAAIRVLKDA